MKKNTSCYQVTMIQIISKKNLVIHELQRTDMSATEKGAGTYNSKKKGCCMKSLLGENYLLRKLVHFSVKNTANNADTSGVHSAIPSALV